MKNINKIKQAKIPHFGPLKGAALANKQRLTYTPNQNQIIKGT